MQSRSAVRAALVVLVACVSVVALTACGGSGPSPRDPTPPAASSGRAASDAPDPEWITVKSAEFHFSAEFPTKPEEKVIGDDDASALHLWAAGSPKHPAAFTVLVRAWAPRGEILSAMHEVALVLTSAKACSGKIVKEQQKGEGVHKVLRFIADCNDAGAIAGELHFDGQRLFIVQIMVQDESLPGDDIKRFFTSFALVP
jgi:hypothetical protein